MKNWGGCRSGCTIVFRPSAFFGSRRHRVITHARDARFCVSIYFKVLWAIRSVPAAGKTVKNDVFKNKKGGLKAPSLIVRVRNMSCVRIKLKTQLY